jgi:hypothetical protein
LPRSYPPDAEGKILLPQLTLFIGISACRLLCLSRHHAAASSSWRGRSCTSKCPLRVLSSVWTLHHPIEDRRIPEHLVINSSSGHRHLTSVHHNSPSADHVPPRAAELGEPSPPLCSKMISPSSKLSLAPSPDPPTPLLTGSGHVTTGQPPGSSPPLFHVRAAKPSGFSAGQMQSMRNTAISSFPGDFQGNPIQVQTLKFN